MSTPRINPNDPKWTAYVLGELDEADREAVERLLEASAEARALVDDLKIATAAIREELASDGPEFLTPAQRAVVRRAAGVDTAPLGGRLPMRWAWGLGAAAAAVIVAAVVQMSREPLAPEGRGSEQTRVALNTIPSSIPQGQEPGSTTPGAATPATTSGAAKSAPTQSGPTQSDAAPPAGTVNPPVAVAPVLTPEQLQKLQDGSSTLPSGPVPVTPPAPAPPAPVRVGGSAATLAGSLAESVTVTAQAPTVDVQNARQRVASETQGQQGQQRQGAAGGRGGRGAGTGPGVSGGIPGGVAPGIPGGMAGGVVGGLPVAPPPAVAAPAGVGAIDSLTRVAPRSDVFYPRPIGTESYARVSENPFVRVRQEPLATFSIDVDTASYSNVRRFLTQNQLPPPDAVRIEELINYFTYDYARPSGQHPISTTMTVTDAPWNPRHRLVRFGVKAREIDAGRRPASNLVFLIDVSGSMNTPQKLPLVKSGLKMLVDQLGENDVVSIVVYASASGLVLPPTSGQQKQVISQAIETLQAGGSTNGGAGIQLAYRQATANFIRGGVNRVILVTDGDFNVGLTTQSELTSLIEERARSGVFLSVLGFGMGNLKDSTMERLADMGNGHYAYIDTLSEARKVLVEEMSNTLVTVAKDVKIQVDFNPAKVEAYRLIGYENRVLRAEDFNNDVKDAGDMGAGHAVTALFEIVPTGVSVPGPSIDPSVFQPAPRDTPPPASSSNDLLVLRVRYKLPDAADSTRMDVPLADRRQAFSDAPADVRFAASVAAFGMILKNSAYRGTAGLEWVLDTATASRGQDRGGYRSEFISLVQKAIVLRGGR
jgi:Ca-activated chloride channel homolog